MIINFLLQKSIPLSHNFLNYNSIFQNINIL